MIVFVADIGLIYFQFCTNFFVSYNELPRSNLRPRLSLPFCAISMGCSDKGLFSPIYLYRQGIQVRHMAMLSAENLICFVWITILHSLFLHLTIPSQTTQANLETFLCHLELLVTFRCIFSNAL